MITNIKNKEIISEEEKYCRSIFSQGWGLMFSRRSNLVMVFGSEKKIRLHNWFVFYAIDLIFLDGRKRVVEVKEGFKPFTFYNPREKCKYLIELGIEGSKGKIRVGDRLEF